MTFFEKYRTEITPKLKEIDICIKIGEPVSVLQAADILGIERAEAIEIADLFGIKKVDRDGFILLMNKGSGYICGLYKRERERGAPYLYTKDDISYIYGLDMKDVEKACGILNMTEATELSLPLLFSLIPA